MPIDKSQTEHRAQHLLTRLNVTVDEAENLSVPTEGLRYLLDFALERGYLANLSTNRLVFPEPNSDPQLIVWMRLLRLPVHPTKVEEFDLLSRWQNVLGTLHAWGHRLIFLLLRYDGETHIYLGAASQGGQMDPSTATRQLWQATLSQMPGVELQTVSKLEERDRIILLLEGMRAAGAITGLPSPRKARGFSDLLQTLDQIAFGIRDQSKDEYDYALMVVADPVSDQDIAEAIYTLRELGSEIHSSVKRSAQDSESESHQRTVGVDLSAMIGVLSSFIPVAGPLIAGVALSSKFNFSRSRTQGVSRSVSSEQIDKVAQYCEYVTDRHVARLQQGRNLGFWSTGAYVLAKTDTVVHTLTGILRSIYSGDESYLEPIRVHRFDPSSGADEWIKQLQQVPLPAGADGGGRGEGWRHPLGPMYEAVATPLNTEELSITTSLPRRDVPGLRFVRNAVRFANNPPPLEEGVDPITLGRVFDAGVSLDLDYAFDVDDLVRHALITGVTGSGKSTTCRRLIKEVMSRGLPMLIIEPARDEYVKWAIEHNKTAPASQQIRVYVPDGSDYYEGTEVLPLRLNPFQPAQIGDKVDIASRYERFCVVLTASTPMTDVLPLVEESINEFLKHYIDPNFVAGDVPAPEEYPKLEWVKPVAKEMIGARGYEQRVKDSLIAAVETCIDALSRGKRGQILNAQISTPFSELFERPAVVNLSQITDDRHKALVMALLVIALFEYRVSKYRIDPDYKQRADGNHLCHLTIIEEAHRLLPHPQSDHSGIGNPQAVVSGMFSGMLSEIRAYGQGLLIVDQVPARLIPDAIKNTNLKIVHRLVALDDRDAMASCMALRLDQEDIIAELQRGEAIVCGDLDDASWVKVEEEPSR
jgi:hypothetical protein